MIGMGIDTIQEREPQVIERRLFLGNDVPARLDRAAGAASDKNRKIVVIVGVAVPEAAAVGDHGLIQQRAIPFAGRFQLVEQVRQALGVELIDLANLGLLCSSLP